MAAFRLRHCRGPEEYSQLVGVVNAAAAANGADPEDTVEVLEHRLAHLNGFDPAEDLMVAEASGEVAGFVRVNWHDEAGTGARGYHHSGAVAPSRRRQGIGTALVGWARQRLGKVAADHDHVGDRVWHSYAWETDAGAEALLGRLGYEVTGRLADMVRPHLRGIPDHPLPTGLDVRPVAPEHMRAIYDAHVAAMADHPGERVRTEADYQKFLANPVEDPRLWLVAWDGDEIAGQVLSFIDQRENEQFGRRRGYTEGISTQVPWRRRGVARALLCEALRVMRDEGMEEAGLAVLVENPRDALRLYRSVGFEVRSVLLEWRKPW